MTSKEALERILMLARPCDYEVREHRNNYCDMLENVIKKDLDRLEQLENALEIIKNKCTMNTNLWLVFCTRTYEDYESFVENEDHKLVRTEQNILTQQEYELLKEVLANE